MTLAQRLNLWYALVLVVTLFLGGAAVDLVSARLARHRGSALYREVQAEISRALQDLDQRGSSVEVYIIQEHYLHSSIPHEVVQQIRRDARLAVLGGGLVVLLLGIGGGSWATRRALAPIRRVADTARHILQTGDSTARIPSPQTRDDLDEMVRMFNSLLDTDQARIRQMRNSLDSIAHDLRTPMTRIRAAAEIALDKGDPDALTDALGTAIEEATAAEQLLTRLLDLTRAEAGMLPLHLQPVDAGAVVERVVSLYEHVAEDRDVKLLRPPSPPITLRADPTRLEQALANLVDNAVKFSPAGGRVWIYHRGEQARAVFVVDDEGPGIPEAERELVFERLYRGDESRNTAGAGLGLAMVRAIAEAHGGTVELLERPGGGTRVELALPFPRNGREERLSIPAAHAAEP